MPPAPVTTPVSRTYPCTLHHSVPTRRIQSVDDPERPGPRPPGWPPWPSRPRLSARWPEPPIRARHPVLSDRGRPRPERPDRLGGRHAQRQGLLAGRLRRWRVLLRERRLLRLRRRASDQQPDRRHRRRRPMDSGYWEVAADGGVFAFGDAGFHGAAAPNTLGAPIVGMARTANNGGYWLVGADGGVFAFGNAGYYGSAVHMSPASPITGIAPTADDGPATGRWPPTAASTPSATPDSDGTAPVSTPAVGIHGANGGYRVVSRDGGTFAFGGAAYHGSLAGHPLNSPIVGTSSTANGYLDVASDGGVFTFGSVGYFGSLGSATVYTPPPPPPPRGRRAGTPLRPHLLPGGRLGQGEHVRGGRQLVRQRLRLRRRPRHEPGQLGTSSTPSGSRGTQPMPRPSSRSGWPWPSPPTTTAARMRLPTRTAARAATDRIAPGAGRDHVSRPARVGVTVPG